MDRSDEHTPQFEKPIKNNIIILEEYRWRKHCQERQRWYSKETFRYKMMSLYKPLYQPPERPYLVYERKEMMDPRSRYVTVLSFVIVIIVFLAYFSIVFGWVE